MRAWKDGMGIDGGHHCNAWPEGRIEGLENEHYSLHV